MIAQGSETEIRRHSGRGKPRSESIFSFEERQNQTDSGFRAARGPGMTKD
jgi:hypothetical protein